MTGYDTVFDEHTTLGEWLMYWLETYVRLTAKPSSYSHYRDNCEKHIIPALGEVPIGEISAKMLQRFSMNRRAPVICVITDRCLPKACATCAWCWMRHSSRL